jgi:hypothetical protein
MISNCHDGANTSDRRVFQSNSQQQEQCFLARNFKPMFGRMERVSVVAHEFIADNLKYLGIERERDISLASYMRSIQTLKINKKRQFLELCYRMHIPWLEVCKFEMWKKQSEQERPSE